jgi:hypothetical protein
MVTRAMVEAKHGVGCIGKKGRTSRLGGAGPFQSEDVTIPTLLLYVNTFQNSVVVLISRIRWLEISSRCKKVACIAPAHSTLKSGA